MSVSRLNDICNDCPRQCNVNRGSKVGFCNTGNELLISSVFLHKGEEPVISGEKGICNVFFAHCNLQCIYCQNYQISQNNLFEPKWNIGLDDAVEQIIEQLDKGVKLLGFVSPSHQTVQMLRIIERLWKKGYKPRVVYNSNGYDSVDTLKRLDGVVDVYLPDFKYFSNDLGEKYSGVLNYFEAASKALKEMYRQKSSTILLDEDGLVESGVIIRHLVLPGHADDSINLLEYIADEISPFFHISLMSQYYPTHKVFEDKNLNRKITKDEYVRVVNKLEECGFKGWIQDMESSNLYRPDFDRSTPF